MAVKPHDPLKIRAADWNTLLQVADAARRGQLSLGAPPKYGMTPYGVVVPVKNATGSDVSRFHAMGLNTPITLYSDSAQNFKNEIGFDGATTSASYTGKFCVAQETIANGKIGMCLIQGVTQAEITVNHADHDRADVDTAGGAKLISNFYGAARILWKESGTGTKWAILLLGDFVAPEMKAIAAATITAGSSGNAAIQINGSGSATVTAHLNWMHNSVDIAADDELIVRYFKDENKWIVTGAEC